MSDVFMSCAREDEERAALLVEKLNTLGLNVWRPTPNENWDDNEIGKQLSGSKVVVVCWTRNSVNSVRVNGEASVAQSNEKLLACKLDECKTPLQFQSSASPDLSGWRGESDHPGWRGLIEKLGSRLGRPGLSALAEALGGASDRELLTWTQRFADDPHARTLRGEIEKRERGRFEQEMAAARKALSDAPKLFDESKNNILDACSTSFEKWISDLENASYDARPNVASALASPEWLDSGAVQRLTAERDAAVKELQSAKEARDEASTRAQKAIETSDAALLEAKRARDALAEAASRQAYAKEAAPRAPKWFVAACLASALAGGLGYRTIAGPSSETAETAEQTRQQLALSSGELQKASAELASAKDDLKARDQTIEELRHWNTQIEEKNAAMKSASEKAAKIQAALDAANARLESLQGAAPASAKTAVGLALEPAAPEQPQKRQAIKFTTFDSGDIQGVDLEKRSSPSVEDCAAVCRDNPACRGYSYDKWNHICFPKSGLGRLRLEPRAISGVVEGSPPPKLATSRVTMEHYNGRAFPGAGFKTALVEGPDECAEICRREQPCVAYTFFWTTGKCRLLDTTGEYFPDRDAESGGKKQAR